MPPTHNASSRRSRMLGSELTATLLASAAALSLVALIYFGSLRLRSFDSALIAYATATVFLAFGVTYRYVR